MPHPERIRQFVTPVGLLALVVFFPAWAPYLFAILRSGVWAQGAFAFVVILAATWWGVRGRRPAVVPPSVEVVAEEIRRTRP
ncbi:MAG: hypothetical protein H0W81_11950 [Chloroflexi bacterium]|nr:hypothetical protein [Chloroflexota bacterium]